MLKKKLSLNLHNLGSVCQFHSSKKPSSCKQACHGDCQAYLASACSPVQPKCQSPSHVRLFVSPLTVAHQAPLSMGILQARILEWAAISFSRGSSPPRDQTQIPRITGRFFPSWGNREVHAAASHWGGTTSHSTLFFKGVLLIQAPLHPSSSSPKSGCHYLCLKWTQWLLTSRSPLDFFSSRLTFYVTARVTIPDINLLIIFCFFHLHCRQTQVCVPCAQWGQTEKLDFGAEKGWSQASGTGSKPSHSPNQHLPRSVPQKAERLRTLEAFFLPTRNGGHRRALYPGGSHSVLSGFSMREKGGHVKHVPLELVKRLKTFNL